MMNKKSCKRTYLCFFFPHPLLIAQPTERPSGFIPVFTTCVVYETHLKSWTLRTRSFAFPGIGFLLPEMKPFASTVRKKVYMSFLSQQLY
jgi:hypothetical protein